jgi:cytochrome b pre-mRNA-processing protein 3
VTAFSGNWFQRRAARRKAAEAAWRGLLRQALEPGFYVTGGVPDTFEGRAAMVTVMTALVCVRLSRIPGPEPARLVSLIDRLALDGFDAAFREKGVGDHSIARKVRKLAETHAGLGKALFAALSASEEAGRAEALAGVLVRNGLVSPERAGALVRPLLTLRAGLEGLADGEVLAGRLDWPRPAA